MLAAVVLVFLCALSTICTLWASSPQFHLFFPFIYSAKLLLEITTGMQVMAYLNIELRRKT